MYRSVAYLVVVLLDDHLKVKTRELTKMAVRPRFLSPKHRPDLSQSGIKHTVHKTHIKCCDHRFEKKPPETNHESFTEKHV